MTSDQGLARVRLIRMPVELWKRSSAHEEAITREFDIMMTDLPKESVPHQLVELITTFKEQFGSYADSTRAEMCAAVERGDDEITLVFEVPPEAAAAAVRLGEVFDEVDAFCRAGEELLSLATPPELVSFRRWFLGEFVRQIDQGLSPMTFEQWHRERGESGVDVEAVPRSTNSAKSESVRFEGDLDLATAGALRDEIMRAREAGAAEVTVDLRGVDFMDSVGLSLLVTAHKRLAEEGVRLQLILPEKLRRLFEISGLTEVLSPEFVPQLPPAADA